MTRTRAAALSLGLLSAASLSPGAQEASPDRATPSVSLVRLLGTPHEFSDKRVSVAGYCHLEFEGDALYIHREDYVHRLFANAVVLDLGATDRRTIGDRSDRHVIVEGTFVARKAYDMGSWGGTLKVESIWVLPPRATGASMATLAGSIGLLVIATLGAAAGIWVWCRKRRARPG